MSVMLSLVSKTKGPGRLPKGGHLPGTPMLTPHDIVVLYLGPNNIFGAAMSPT